MCRRISNYQCIKFDNYFIITLFDNYFIHVKGLTGIFNFIYYFTQHSWYHEEIFFKVAFCIKKSRVYGQLYFIGCYPWKYIACFIGLDSFIIDGTACQVSAQ